jgi:hypothetical protein
MRKLWGVLGLGNDAEAYAGLPMSMGASMQSVSVVAPKAGLHALLRGRATWSLFLLGAMILAFHGGRATAQESGCGDATPAQCEIIEILRPYRTGLVVQTQGNQKDYSEDDALVFDISNESEDCYLLIGYIASDDTVNIIGASAEPVETGSTLRLGDGSPGAGTFFVSEPFGTDMIVAIATRRPVSGVELGQAVELDGFIAELDDLARQSGILASDFTIIHTKNGAF